MVPAVDDPAAGQPAVADGDLEALLVRVGTGDEQAFGDLYDRVAARLHGLVTRLVVDRAQADEVTQEVFLEIWQTAARFDPNRGRALSWALTLAHRRAVDRIRTAQADRNRDARVGARDRQTDEDPVAEHAETAIEHERVRDAMESLTSRQREAMSLAYYGGLSHSEIAGRLGVPIGTVKTRLHDGMRALRRRLGVQP